MDERCSVCGHPIFSMESVRRGYGSECAKAIQSAQFQLLKEDKENSLKYFWLIEIEILQKLFLKVFVNVNFRSDFRSSFFQSMKKAKRISRKQKEIMFSMLDEKITPEEKGNLLENIRETKKNFLNNYFSTCNVSRKAIEIARKNIRK